MPFLPLHRHPAFVEPQVWPLVATVSHELEEFTVGDKPVGYRKRFKQYPMSRRLVVVSEVITVVTDPTETAFVFLSTSKRGGILEEVLEEAAFDLKSTMTRVIARKDGIGRHRKTASQATP